MLAPAKAYTQNKHDKLISFDKQLSFLEDKLGSYPPKLQPQERIEIERKLYKLNGLST